MNYTSIILADVNQEKIELIAFKTHIEKLKQFRLIENNYYTLKNVQTIWNTRFKRTNHKFKLKFDSISTQIKLIDTFKIIRNSKIYVVNTKKKENNKNKNDSQLSIMNFLNVKKRN